MEDYVSKGNCAPLPLSALRLLVPPIQLVSAAIWQTVQQRVVADYGMLEEFISMVTDIVPELITSRQRAQLTLGLRARLILELCQFEATADFGIIQPHLDRMHILTEAWETEAGAVNMDEQPNSDFVNLVKNLLNNPEERERFFQKVFIEEFGPTYDDSLHTLTWLFLSRLEKFLPLQTFQQVAAMFGETSSVLEGCIESVSQCEELRTLLHYQKNLRQLDHNDGSLDGSCIISALKLPSVEGTMTEKPELQSYCLHDALSGTSELEKESLALPHITQTKPDTITQDQTSQINSDQTNWVPGENGTAAHLVEIINHEENFGRLKSQEKDASRLLKECSVQLKRLDNPASSGSRPVRRNRGLKMKMILLEEKRGSHKKDPTTCKTKPSNVTPPENSAKDSSSFSKDSSYLAPISTCSENDSWSYYSDQGSCHKGTTSSPSNADSWSNYSDDVSSCETPVNNSKTDRPLSTSSNEDLSLTGPREDKDLSATRRKKVTSDIKAGALKKTREVVCFICKEQVKTKLRVHMKTHFPNEEYACPRCDSRFKVLTSFRLHLKRTCFEHSQQQVGPDEAQNLYKCDQCEEVFRYKLSLEVHKQTHNELYCNVCRKVLRDAAALARHKASHTMLQCPRCEETFTLYKPLLKHCENVHKISRPFKCNHCPKTYSRLRILIGHEWKHTGHLPFRCARCGLRFRSDADLLSHGRVHTGERPYLCAECGKTFSQKSNLVRHLHFIHSDSRDEKKHSCTECGKSFKEKGALKKHQKSKHYKELFRHPCQYCGKMFSASSIVRHKLIHTGERPFKCTVPMCEKYFRSTSEVKKHVLIHHTTERPYKCDVCGKGFIKMGLLNSHSKIHSGEKPFVCHFCGKAFHKLYGMQRHKKLVHTFI